MSKPAVWEPVDPGQIREGALSLAVCPDDPARPYLLGTLDGLFVWTKSAGGEWAWKHVPQKGDQGLHVSGQVRDVLAAESNNCGNGYAATIDRGVWRIAAGRGTRIDEPGDAIQASRSVILRDDLLFVGTTEGVRAYDVEQKKWQPSTVVTGLVTKQSLSGSRIYAAVWTAGVSFNDSCSDPDKPNNCVWSTPALQPDNKYVRDVVGSPKGAWIVAGTAGGVFHWDGKIWRQPEGMPTGDIFALAQAEDGRAVFAAVAGQIWYWNVDDVGLNWSRLGNLSFPVIDLTVAGDYLYATTTNFGIWRWPLH